MRMRQQNGVDLENNHTQKTVVYVFLFLLIYACMMMIPLLRHMKGTHHAGLPLSSFLAMTIKQEEALLCRILILLKPTLDVVFVSDFSHDDLHRLSPLGDLGCFTTSIVQGGFNRGWRRRESE